MILSLRVQKLRDWAGIGANVHTQNYTYNVDELSIIIQAVRRTNARHGDSV